MAKDHARAASRPFFPVADHQLPKIHVTPEQHEELRAYLLPMVQEVIREGPTWGRSNVRSAQRDGWKVTASTVESCLLTKSSGKNYRSSYSSSNSSSKANSNGAGKQPQLGASMQTPPTSGQCFMGYSQVPFSLEDVMNSAYGETTEELRVHYTQNYGSMCLDSCVLKTLEGATLEDPFWYMGIKWLALKSPVKKLVSSREFAFIDLTGTHVQSDGQRMLYRIVQSVDLKGYGGKDSYFGLTRAHIEAALVYWVDETKSTPERPVLNVCTKGRAHLKGSMPLWLVQLYLKKMWNTKRSLHLDDALQSPSAAAPGTTAPARAITARKHSSEGRSSIASSGSDSAPLDMATTWVPNEERTSCYVCQKKFQRVRRPKHHCRSCGEVICSECTSYSKLNVRSLVRIDSSLALLSTGSSNNSNKDFSESNAVTMQNVKHAAKARAPRHVVRESQGMYVTVGKVCHRCMELKSIMHNNSTAFQSQQPQQQMVPWKNGYDAQDEKLRTLHPERDASENGNGDGDGDGDDAVVHNSSNDNNRFAPLGSPCEEKYEAAAEEESEGSDHIAGSVPTSTKQGRNRRGSLSSMTSSEVCAIIEENGQCELHPIGPRATDSATEMGGGDSTAGTAAVDTSSAVSDKERGFDDDIDDDEEEEEDADSNEDLEFKPVLANAVPAHELLANSAAGRDSEISGSLSSFNPDFLFDFQQEFSDDDDDDEDDDKENKNSKTEFTVTKDQSLPPLSPHATTPLSPTDSTTLSTSSWPRARSQRGSVSITDVQLAIADNAKLLEVLKRERESEEDYEQTP